MKSTVFTAIALMGIAAGCFPESEDYKPNVFLQIPIGQMSNAPTQEEIDRWQQWHTMQQAQHSTYQLDNPDNQQGNNFYLSLGMDCLTGETVSVQGIGSDISIADENGQPVIDIQLKASFCSRGVFNLHIYWVNKDYGIEFFSGASQELQVPPTSSVIIDVFKHRSATLICDSVRVLEPGSYKFAILDTEENVRLPPVDVTVRETLFKLEFSGLPIERRMIIQKCENYTGALCSEGDWKNLTDEVTLTLPNEYHSFCGNLLPLE